MISPSIHPRRIRVPSLNTEEALRRWPRIAAHLIAESIGYFSPEGSANALLLFKRDQDNYCEWFLHMAYLGRKPIRQVAVETIRRAIRGRSFHRGYMASYKLALKIIRERIATGVGPVFGSWF
jgi:hypothetical protein